MKSHKIDHFHGLFLVVMGIAFALALAWASAAYAAEAKPGGPAGVDIQIRAQNRSTDDTPFCGGVLDNASAGSVGDRLDVDAFMDPDGNVTGTARFEDANGNVTTIEIDTILPFAGPFYHIPEGVTAESGGLVLQDLRGPGETEDVVAIWLSNGFPWDPTNPRPSLVSVELPRGCDNTVSTFTPGVDKVSVMIKYH